MDKETKIDELDIKDEFILADSNESVAEIAKKLRELQEESDTGTVLVTQNNEVIGFISDKELVEAVGDGKNLREMNAKELMSTDYVEVMEYETIGDIIPIIENQYPNAIVVIDDRRNCIGYFSKNDYKDALAGLGVYDKRHEPKTSDDWRTRGVALSALGKKIEALKCFESSLGSKKDRDKSWSDLAKRLERLNRHKEAIMCYDKALSIDSGNDEALVSKGKIFSKENTQNLALQSYKLAISINPDNTRAWMSMGMEQANQGDIDEAIKCFDKAQELKGENPELWFRRGNAYEKVKQYEDALVCYDNAIMMDESYEDAWFSKGIVLNSLGKKEDTLNCLVKLLEINPNNESAKEAINNYKENGEFRF